MFALCRDAGPLRLIRRAKEAITHVRIYGDATSLCGVQYGMTPLRNIEFETEQTLGDVPVTCIRCLALTSEVVLTE